MGPWLTAGAVLVPLAVAAIVVRRPAYLLVQPAYLRWLLRPWRLATFGVALLGIVLIAPYTGDPYWDAVDASVMATATFYTAPWAVASAVRRLRLARSQRPRWDELAVALVALLFSASWSYDAWILVRDGQLPFTQFENLVASTCLYLFAGLFWGLDTRNGRPTWGPLHADWPAVHPGGFRTVWLPAGLIMLFIALLMVSSALGWV